MDKGHPLTSLPTLPQTGITSPPPFHSHSNEGTAGSHDIPQRPFSKLAPLAENISNADRLSQLQLQVEFLASKLHDTLAFVHTHKSQVSSDAPSQQGVLDKFIDQVPNDFLISTETIFKLLDTLPPRPTTLDEALPTLHTYANEIRSKERELEFKIRSGDQLLSLVQQTRLDVLRQEAERLRSP
ncbi:hypothetical protein HMI54_005967 [Coelomomyces lativittatus]|nr:hypothetical protein HMI54_005967 [Coelomomyces lativittatus]KAJ1513493.1 hypothetical protein HMI56_002360 [Coelomomyces lativittatus]KAJ1516171.1 hypothetical protein HMI55_002830 [Coelomomyces lativittatus]